MADAVSSPQSAGEGAQGGEAPAFTGSDNATGTESFGAMQGELGPNGLPVHPPAGDPGENVDADFLMNTFFGDGQAPAPNSGGGQGDGPTPPDGQSQQGPLAPPAPAPAANGGEGSPAPQAQPGPSPTPQPGQQQAGEGGAAPQTPPQAQPASGEQPAPSQDGLTLEQRLQLASLSALQEQNAQLIERLRAAESGQPQPQPQGQPQPGAQPAPGAAPQPAGPPEEAVRLVVPDALYDAVMSEDRATSIQAMSALITGVAQNAVKAAVAAVPQIVDSRVQQFTQVSEAARQQEAMESQYYEAFPAHQNEMFRPLIQQVTREKYTQFPNAPWNADMINAVGATVTEKLKALGIDPLQLTPAAGGQQPQGQPQPNGGQPAPRPGPAPMLDSTTRGGNGQGAPQDAGDFIASTFG